MPYGHLALGLRTCTNFNNNAGVDRDGVSACMCSQCVVQFNVGARSQVIQQCHLDIPCERFICVAEFRL